MGKKLNDLRKRVKRLEQEVRALAKALQGHSGTANPSKSRRAKATTKSIPGKSRSARGNSPASKHAPRSAPNKAPSAEKRLDSEAQGVEPASNPA